MMLVISNDGRRFLVEVQIATSLGAMAVRYAGGHRFVTAEKQCPARLEETDGATQSKSSAWFSALPAPYSRSNMIGKRQRDAKCVIAI
jgi:hypothetical protein